VKKELAMAEKARRKPVRKKSPRQARPAKPRRWSQRVTEQSDALDLDRGVFSFLDPRQIALSLRRSAVRSRRRKSDPFRSAMSIMSTAPAGTSVRTASAS
jgi:hypothetical protein